jgi:hypothetical protein
VAREYVELKMLNNEGPEGSGEGASCGVELSYKKKSFFNTLFCAQP